MGYSANVSKAELCIPKNTPMAGYIDRSSGSLGVHDSLYTKSLAISDGSKKIVLITNDMLSVDREIVDFVSKGIKEKYGLDEENVFICASHTHSGPSICQWKYSDDCENLPPQVRKLKDEIKSSILENALKSLESLKPVNIKIGHSQNTDVACNRIDPKYEADTSMNIIKIDDYSGNTISLIINYSCHPTVMGADNLLISADYPGSLMKKVEEKFIGSTALFINGACGDVSTRFTRKSQNFLEIERLADVLYESVLRALDHMKPVEGKVSCLKQMVTFPFKAVESYDDTLKLYQEAKKAVESADDNKCSAAEKRKIITRYQGAAILLELQEYLKNKTSIDEYIQVMKIGKLLVIGFPVELFTEYGLKLKQLLGPQNVIISCYTNNLLGYMYTPASLASGDYEALSSPFAADTGEKIVSTVMELINHIDKN